jgi:UDPglucose--hexose-1-phosphate uridylyltransferase
MPSLRAHPITGEPILYAPERASRPNTFEATDDGARCPFCAGHENDTPPEIARVGDPWRVRVFPNKYPAVEGHEIIVESPSHDAGLHDVPHAPDIIATYAGRYRAHAERSAFVSLFTNHGARAGASLEHLHSQLMPLPFVPAVIGRQKAAFASAATCPLCVTPPHVISENGTFLRIAPDGAAHAWEQWLVPKRHQPDFGTLSASEEADLAAVLQQATRSTSSISAAYNVIWYPFAGEAAAHFYVVVIPRTTSMAGFEISTGTFIDTIDPAATVRRFR